jgi:hypothetical protein
MFTESGRGRKGAVGIESFRGRLRLRLPHQLFNGKQKYVRTGLADTSVNRKAVEAKVKLIESDIAFERFDYTLAKYGKSIVSPFHIGGNDQAPSSYGHGSVGTIRG